MISGEPLKKYLLFGLRLLLGLIFAIEAYYKFKNPSGFGDLVRGMGVLPEFFAAPYILLLPYVEILVAIGLFLGIYHRFVVTLAGLILLSILIGFQLPNITGGLYTSFLMGLRGILQDQHLWMLAAAKALFLYGPGMRTNDHT